MVEFKRSISKEFFNDLYHDPRPNVKENKKDSILHPFLKRVWNDDTLNMELRCNEVHIYYRGGTFLKIKERNDETYKIETDKGYYGNYYEEQLDNLNGKIINKYEDSEECLQYFSYMKDAMDLHFNTVKKRYERAYQQQVIRDNNNRLSGGKLVFKKNYLEEEHKNLRDEKCLYNDISNNSDYFIIDMEVTTKGKSKKGKPDLFGVKWSSDKEKRKSDTNLDLAFIELKFASSNLRNGSGIKKHYEDILKLIKEKNTLEVVKEDLKKIFNQKRDLLVLNNKKYIKSFSDNIDFILLFVNHNPNSSVLINVLTELQEQHQKEAPENLNIKVATSNFMGAALQEESVYELSEFMDKFSDQISKN